MKNQITFKQGELEVNVISDKPLEKIVPIIQEIITKLSEEKEKTTNNETFDTKTESKYEKTNKIPPIWLIECKECGEFIIVNRMNFQGDTFICPKCKHEQVLDESIVSVASYECECGCKHTVAIHSINATINTKCRECKMPIDLVWNKKKRIYEKIK